MDHKQCVTECRTPSRYSNLVSGFVSHPKKSLLGGRRITNHGIELPEFK
jgi:hypothetical protein